MSKLEDVFAGQLELTASERSFIFHALQELYIRGAAGWKGENPRNMLKRVGDKFSALKLSRMVSPDGTKLVSVAEHDAIIAIGGMLKDLSADERWARLAATRDIVQAMLAELAED